MKEIILTLSCLFFFLSLAFTQSNNMILVLYHFENRISNWTTSNIAGGKQWHYCGNDRIEGSKCTRLILHKSVQAEKYLQLYLDKFYYRLNRRYLGERRFDRLTIAVTSNYWYDEG